MIRPNRKHYLHFVKEELNDARQDPKYDYYFSLVRNQVKKKRKCLGCGQVEFESVGHGHRMCSSCSCRINRYHKEIHG